jgi:hypothetical protein
MGSLVVLKANGQRQIIEQDTYPTLEQLQALVGGYIELVCVDYDGSERDMYINENGKIDGLLSNIAATALYQDKWPTHDYIVGDAVIVFGLQEQE